MKRGLIGLGSFLLLCGAAPLIYGIVNAGTVTLGLLGIFFVFLPRLWRMLSRFLVLKRLLAVCMTVLFVFCAVLSASMAYKAWFNEPPKSGEMTVIILGAKVSEGQPSLMLRRRLNVAYDYLRENGEAVCVVTGGQGPDEDSPEARVMADYLINRGLEPERIRIEDKSTSTRENFRFAAPLTDADAPVVIVTDSFHQMRASIYAKAELSGADEREFYALSSYTPWGLIPSYWMRDMLGIVMAIAQTMTA